MKTPYTYLIGWSDHDKWYYGVRFSKKSDTDELMNTYFTSSKYVKEFIINFGLPNIIEIRKTFKNINSARIWETKVLGRLSVISSEKWLNKTNNKSISIECCKKTTENHRWFTDGNENIFCKPENSPPKFWRGRICPWKGKSTQNINEKFPYNNKQKTIYVTKDDPILLNKIWIAGKIPNTEDIRIGRHWYTNGKESKLISDIDKNKIPKLWKLGRHWSFAGENNPRYNKPLSESGKTKTRKKIKMKMKNKISQIYPISLADIDSIVESGYHSKLKTAFNIINKFTNYSYFSILEITENLFNRKKIGGIDITYFKCFTDDYLKLYSDYISSKKTRKVYG